MALGSAGGARVVSRGAFSCFPSDKPPAFLPGSRVPAPTLGGSGAVRGKAGWPGSGATLALAAFPHHGNARFVYLHGAVNDG